MFSKLLRAAAAAAMAFGTLSAGLNTSAAFDDCLSDAPIGYCCDTAASGPKGDPCCDNAASGTQGDPCCDYSGSGPQGYPCCYGPANGNATESTVDPCCYEGQQPQNGINPDCETPMASIASVRGTAYEDKNANGKRDAGEPTMAGAWLKLSGGGAWFVCAYTGADATYAIPVIEVNMTYIIFPIAPVGWKTTTPVIKAKTVNTTNGFAFLYNDMGFVRDASVKTVDGCDQYNPSRAVPPGL